MEWKEVLLSEFLEFNPKRTIKKNEVARKITMDLLIPHSKQIYSFKYEPYTGGAKFSNGDTIMARITPCLENGKHAYVSCLNEGEIAYGSTEYIVLCGKNGVSDNEFVYYLSHTPQFVNTAIKSMVGSSGRQRAQVPVLENLIMPVPVNLSDQRKIAGILSALDSKIENNNKINANLEAQAQALFKSWFVDFTPFKDQPFVDSELGPIPQGLKICQISDISHTLETGRRQKGGAVSEGIPSVGAEHVKGMGTYDYSKTKYISPEFANKLKTGKINGYELLIYKDGGKPGYFIPNFSIFGEGYPFDLCYLNEHVFKLDFLQNKGYNIFNYFQFKTNYVMSFLNAQGGKAAIPGINKKDIECIYTFAPNNPKVVEFGNFALPLFTKILRNCVENQRLAALRDTLLPKLMSGEIKL